MRHSPTNEKCVVTEVKVVDVEKRRTKDSSGKNYEYELKVRWSDDSQYNIFRRYSMFFDLQAGLKNLFQEKQNFGISIPELPVTRFAGGMLFGAFSKKQCKHVEDFCQRVIQLPPVVAQSEIVLAFFSRWATDGSSRNDTERGKVPSPSRNDEQVVERYQSVAAFSGSGRGEMTLRENEVVTVIEKNNTGWWLVANSRGDHGFAPATFLEPFDAGHQPEEEEWREVDDDDRYWIAIDSYTAKSDDELTYRAGEEVEVLATSNFGWWKIRLKGEVGLTPGSNLTPKPRNDNMDPFMTEEQRKRSSTYSSIYASIRAPPPRRDSSKTLKDGANDHEVPKAKVLRSQSTPYALEYATVEIAPSPQSATRSSEFNFENARDGIPQYATVIPKHLRVRPRPRSMSEDSTEETNRLQRSGYPDLPPPPPSLLVNSHEDLDDPSYTTVKEIRVSPINTSPRVKLLRAPDGEIVRSGSRKYQNVLKVDTLSSTPSEHYVAMTNYSPNTDRPEDLPLSAGETVRLLTEDGVWAFVCTVDPTRRRGWVPASILKKKGGIQHSYARRSLSVGDIYDAYEEEEAAAQAQRVTPILSSHTQKRPVPTPRGDLDKTPVDMMAAPSEPAPPLPGAPSRQNRKPGKINAYYFATEDFTTNNSKCICVRKGEVGQLLEVQSAGWWKMNVEGVLGWTPGEFWDILQESDDDTVNNNLRDRSRHSSFGDSSDRSRHSSFGDELWYYGKMSRQKCEELMLRSAKELDYLIRESTQKFASFVLSVKYGGRIRHFPIELTPSGRYVIGKHAFDGLTEIVTFYKQNALFYTQNKQPISLGDSFRGI